MMNKFIFVIFLMFHLAMYGKKPEAYSIPVYDIVCNGVGNEGTYIAKVSVYLPKPDKGVDDNIRKAAVHGSIFKGLGSSKECTGQKPLSHDLECEQKNKDFFELFFSDKMQYSRYVSIIEGTLQVTKVEKKQYCISAIVTINKDDLRKLLEQNGIIQSFNDLF